MEVSNIGSNPAPYPFDHGEGDDSAVGSLDLTGDPCKLPNSMDILRKFNDIFTDRLAIVDQTQSSEDIKVNKNKNII